MENFVGYGYVTDIKEESKKIVQGGNFGGNFGTALLTKFAYSPNVSKTPGEVREAIEIIVTVKEKEYRHWITPVTKVYSKEQGGEITDTQSEEYRERVNEEVTAQNAVVIHYLKAVGVSEDAIKNAFTTPVASFGEYAQRMCALLPIGYDKRPLDVFLEYQWKPSTKADGTEYDKTFPTLPKNLKGGYFIIPAQPGVWTEVRGEDKGLCYTDANGAYHPFDRNAFFMKGPKGTQYDASKDAKKDSNPMTEGSTPANGGATTGSAW